MFYDKYVELCKQKGVTPTAAALEIGLSKATPTKWKRSGATPSGDNLKKIAAYFGITESELLSEEKIQPCIGSTSSSQQWTQRKTKMPSQTFSHLRRHPSLKTKLLTKFLLTKNKRTGIFHPVLIFIYYLYCIERC